MSNGSNAFPYLAMLRQGKPFRIYPIRKNVITIGRAPNNDIVIMDRRISRYHARLRYHNGQWVIEDLGSDNGIWVNGNRIQKSAFVTDDNIIMLGQAIQFELELRPDAPHDIPQRKFLPGWVWQASIGIGGIIASGILLLGLLAILGYFVFGIGRSGEIDKVNIDNQPTAEVIEANPAPATEIAEDINDAIGPQTTIQEPLSGTTIPLGGVFTVSAVAHDGQGIIRMEIWVDDQLAIAQDSPQPEGITPFYLSHGMKGTSEGIYAITIRAYNSQGVMGESLATYVTVTENQQSDTTKSALYLTQAGDTLASIANEHEITLDELKNANPDIGEISGEGQMLAISLPLQALVAPSPDKAPLSGLNPTQIGEVTQVKPEIMEDGIANQVFAELIPDPAKGENLAQLPPPSNLSGKINNCSVNLEWKNNTTSASSIFIYRRRKPDQIKLDFIAQVGADKTSYSDKLLLPGTYEYTLKAVGQLKEILPEQSLLPQPVTTIESGISRPLGVHINPSEGCLDDPDRMKMILFQPLSFSPHEHDVIKANIWYAISDSKITRRIPAAQGQYLHTGKWNVAPEFVPAIPQVFLNQNQPFFLGVWAQGQTSDSILFNKSPENLGIGFESVSPLDIKNNPNKTYSLFGDRFAIQYKLWISEISWLSQGWTVSGAPGGVIPAPTNLHIITQDMSHYRKLAWEWSGDEKTIDGFILYRSYTCPGQKDPVRAPELIGEKARQTWVMLHNEPAGCLYHYRLTAYGRYGESAASNAVEGTTQSGYSKITVTFNDLDANTSSNKSSEIVLTANHYNRTTTVPVILSQGKNDLSRFFFDGSTGNNSLSVDLGEQEYLTIGYTIKQLNGILPVSEICSGTIIPASPPAQWQDNETQTFTTTSSNQTCAMNISVQKGNPASISSGQMVKSQVDLEISRIARIGNAIYVLVSNNGPDDLSDSEITVQAHEGFYYEDTDRYSTFYSLPMTIVQSELKSHQSQWMHISKKLDDYYALRQTMPEPSNQPNCGLAFRFNIILQPSDNYDDNNTYNDQSIIMLSDIRPID